MQELDGLLSTMISRSPIAPDPRFPEAKVRVLGGLVGLRQPEDEEGVPYYVFLPSRPDPQARPLVAVHGISRGADEQLSVFAPWAEHTGRVLVAPYFSEAQCGAYQRVIEDRCQADRALFAVLRDVAALTGAPVERFDLFGFSGGAQFAHRFALLHPERVAHLALASAGWYTLPARKRAFPYGLAPGKGTGRLFHAKLEAFLEIPTLVLVGERDVTRDPGLRKGRRLDRRQGRNRVQRARTWAKAMHQAAADLEIAGRFELQILPDCGHGFLECVRVGGLTGAVMAWFDPKKGA